MTTTGPSTNWAGNLAFGARAVHRPRTLGELRELVRRSDRIRALGSGHSFSAVADTDGDLVLLDALPTRIDIAPDARTVTVSAATRYAELAVALQSAGLALENLASLPHITVAGATATGTHGSGDGRGSLSAAVRSLEIVGADGESSTHTHPGAVVHLGALGIVTALTLDVVPTFDLRQYVHLGLALADYRTHLDEIHAAGYSVSLFTDWGSDTGRVWVKQLVDGSPATAVPGARPADGPQHPVPGMPTVNCTPQLGAPGPWHERLPHFRPEFTPSSGAELQSEFLLPRAAAGPAVAELRALGPRLAPVLHISEVRTVAADDRWLSPSYGRASVAFHFTWKPDLAAVTPVLGAVERALLPLGGRPHWGKLTLAGRGAGNYERLPDFLTLRRALDPAGKFGNRFTEALTDTFGGSPL
ncbi:FAD-binding protein [Kitasatospora sp. MMS16-BH015]|uniref:FAD-binding protein n=1 Tax=Kitasatospora sp. MMS16-BH015 TaxID=2018025 RepID=UPI000CA19D46|nr:FAD-binding protein [Kitasatospora sp. MMS16-BH015]AUG81889.1 FAD-binding protein [Kitasatospora sp. MMS16-BH015]